MKINSQHPVVFENACNAIYSEEDLVNAALWYSTKPICRHKKVSIEAFSFTWVSNSGFYGCTYALVDNETGVNYIVVERNSKYGEGVSITPRFNVDGTLYVSEVE